jgi:glycosyltransferase involved in cell wall biosynthesis
MRVKQQDLRVALVHDFLVQEGGAEQVLKELTEMFPSAPIFTLVADFEKAGKFFKKEDVRTSFIQKLPLSKRKYQWYLPLMPAAIESFDLSEYDVVISSSSAFAKGVLTQPYTIHICYCHSPTRYLWTDTHSYVQDLPIPSIIKKIIPFHLSRLRVWDLAAAGRPDIFLANSNNVLKRIKKYYRRDAQILYPPVRTDEYTVASHKENYFLAGGRLVGYKHFDIIIDAFNQLGIPLKIFGSGPLQEKLSERAKKNITFLGMVSDVELKRLYTHAKAYINPQEEDFGLTMTEALASGCPIIAYKAGGALEIVQDGINGTFFEEQSWEALADSVVRLREKTFDPKMIQMTAQTFSRQVFKEKFLALLEKHKSEYGHHRG